MRKWFINATVSVFGLPDYALLPFDKIIRFDLDETARGIQIKLEEK